MSSFRAELTVDNETFVLDRVYFEMNRLTDKRNKPASKPTFSVWIRMESTDKTTIVNWMADPKKAMDATLTFYQTDQETKFREINLFEAGCYNLHEWFASDQDCGMLQFVIVAITVGIGSETYSHIN